MVDNQDLYEALGAVDRALHWTAQGTQRVEANGSGGRPVFVPAIRPQDLGDPSFRADHGLRYAYVAGAMANGIGSEQIVEAMSRAGMLGFFGAAGLPLDRVEAAIDKL